MSLKVFLGGTCTGLDYRGFLEPLLSVEVFNPVVKHWGESERLEEIQQRESCSHVLYVITPYFKGVYSIAEVVDDSNKRPEKTLFCVLDEYHATHFSPEAKKSLEAVKELVSSNGVACFDSLEDIACYLNGHTPAV